jgi:putative peptide zinc metalloprotease protein
MQQQHNQPAAQRPLPSHPATPATSHPAGTIGAASDGVSPGERRCAPPVPQLAPGVEILGEYLGSGLTTTTYLARRPDGRVVQLSRLLYLVLAGVDGHSTTEQIAEQVSGAFGRTVSAGNIEYLLAGKLAPLGLLGLLAAGETGRAGKPQPAILTLKARRILVPAGAVGVIARIFQPLFHPVVVVAVLAGFVTTDVVVFSSSRISTVAAQVLQTPIVILLVLGLLGLSLLFHECGHAAACRYGGARPGVIGMGIYVVWPALYTNVTDVYRLGRAGRLRTDLGGIYFNMIFIVGLSTAYLATDYAPLFVALILVHVEIFQQLLPTLRLDGYFILADVAGVPDLFQRMAPVLRSVVPGRPADPRVRDLGRPARLIVTSWVLLTVPFLGLYMVFLALQGPEIARTFAESLHVETRDMVAAFGQVDIAAGLVDIISVILLTLPMIGLIYIAVLTARRILRVVVAVTRRLTGARRLRTPTTAVTPTTAMTAPHAVMAPPATTVVRDSGVPPRRTRA